MNTLSLCPAGLPYLDKQATQNGTFTHLLRDEQGLVRGMVRVIVEQCDQAIAVRVELGESRHSTTLPRGADAGERIARFVEFIANGEQNYGLAEVGEHAPISEEEEMLRRAIRNGQGTYCMACAGEIDVDLVLQPAASDPRRSVFRFALNGVSMTLPVLLPADRQRAYELLSDCVRELVANYRSGAAA